MKSLLLLLLRLEAFVHGHQALHLVDVSGGAHGDLLDDLQDGG